MWREGEGTASSRAPTFTAWVSVLPARPCRGLGVSEGQRGGRGDSLLTRSTRQQAEHAVSERGVLASSQAHSLVCSGCC